jgi:hypothetical protein
MHRMVITVPENAPALRMRPLSLIIPEIVDKKFCDAGLPLAILDSLGATTSTDLPFLLGSESLGIIFSTTFEDI